ncbi:MAG: DUF1178 family protein [Rhodospirillaceae bacterium]|nr:MAG: DUF1178 family protein [Rhodospirillaceae bacterium]
MILYDLVCDKDHGFESWFRNSTAADKLLKAGQSPCPRCGSVKVRKAPMAPRLGKGTAKDFGAETALASAPAGVSSAPEAKLPAVPASPPAEVAAAMENAAQALTKLRETIEKNFEHVGEKFPEEARRIHYGEAPERAIYGDASLEEAQELVEEGIKVAAIPWPKRRN